jgi:ubiquinone/menaquinone biosynthesis C-methylase UbiE
MPDDVATQPPAGLTDSYAAAFGAAAPVSEQRRLSLQSALYARLATWTFTTLDIIPGQQVLEIGCGGGTLLVEAAERVGPHGRVVGVDRDPRLVAEARERVAAFPWVEVVEGDALAYEPDGRGFDAVHCRFVLMHQRDPIPLLERMVALVRPGGRIAAQELDADGATSDPTLTCFPACAALERLSQAYLATSRHRGTDPQLGRKLLALFERAGLQQVEVEGSAAIFSLTDPRAGVVLDLFGRAGASAEAEAARVLAAAEYDGLLAAVRRAHADPGYSGYLVRGWTVISAAGTKRSRA